VELVLLNMHQISGGGAKLHGYWGGTGVMAGGTADLVLAILEYLH